MPMVQPRTFVTSPLWMSEMSDTPAGEDGVIPEEAQDNPCWQDLYDDDCDTSVYAANFVAAKWIKSMPCASGVEVRKRYAWIFRGIQILFLMICLVSVRIATCPKLCRYPV